MPESFSISRSLSSGLADPDLHDLIRDHTGSVGEARSIVRSIRRFGDDASIDHYDLIPTPGRRGRAMPQVMTWSVRAVRHL